MKSRTLILILAICLTFLTLLILFISKANSIRWDKIPLIGAFVLEVELWPSGFDASYISEPIKWYQLDDEPIDWEEFGVGSWFSFNTYTKNLLKDYMKNNNLGIVPNCWTDFKYRANFEECLETFEFVELNEDEKAPSKKSIIPKVLLVTFSFLSIACWILFFILKRHSELLL